VTVGRAGEGPDWRGFCAAVTLRFSAPSPELAGGGGGNQAIRFLECRLGRSGRGGTTALVFQQAAPGAACLAVPDRTESHCEPDSGPNVRTAGATVSKAGRKSASR
jgi:hypothetical protein